MVDVKKSLINFFSRNLKCELGEVKFITRNTPNNRHIKEFYYYSLYNNQITISEDRAQTWHRQRDKNIVLMSLHYKSYQSTPSITHLINFMLTTCTVDGATSLTNKDLEYKSGFKFHALCFVYVSVMYIFTYYQFLYAAADVSNSAMKQHNNVAVNIFRKYQP